MARVLFIFSSNCDLLIRSLSTVIRKCINMTRYNRNMHTHKTNKIINVYMLRSSVYSKTEDPDADKKKQLNRGRLQ